MINDAYNKYYQELLNNIKNIPQDLIKDPDLQKVANALEDSKYCVEKETIRHSYPIVHYQIAYANHSETIIKNVFLENEDAQDINLQSRSISCLENLGLVKVHEDIYFYGKMQMHIKNIMKLIFIYRNVRMLSK